ncbi:MAG TPA: hypothetical protein VMB66_05965, partial [Candidatus Acidoferrales bacterium]|nr:hypothetical protein [Candidatus Acidoferrales bacterium]
MKRLVLWVLVCGLPFLFSVASFAGELKILTNHLGYEVAGPKHAVILGRAGDHVSDCSLNDNATDL